ncbi:MAG: DUF6069 family protein [Sphingobacteriales bacterium JAD_PAG50586_3]|nr:MAG: DUF6069 family protein [Sphingobacteriales bacterium JAD_PAG50586_3]
MKAKLSFKQSIVAGLLAAGTAAIVNAILFFIFHAAGIITDDIMVQPNMPMTVVPVIISSILPTLIATVVFFLLEKYTANGFKIFTIISVILMVLSFANPFVGIPGIGVAYGIVLNVMHVVVVAALLFFINRAKNTNA